MHIQKLFNLKGKVAIVTGAVGQLGTQIAKALLEAGADVIIADLNLSECQEKARTINKNSPRCIGVELDVTKKESVKKMTALTIKKFGRIDILVNNAGIAVVTPFEKRKLNEFDKVIKVNINGVFLCSQIISKQMMKQKEGNIINIGSIYGVVSPDPRIYADSGRNSSEVYGITKAGVISLTRYLAVHLAKYNIRVNCISPGGIFNKQSPEFVENYCSKTPLGKMGSETDIKGAVVYLASKASDYVTGHNLIIDGGWTIW